MPTRKPRLSQTERGTYFTAARDLREAGVEIKSLEDFSKNTRAIDVRVAGGLGSMVTESSFGRVHYAVWVHLVARHACRLLGCRITTRWDHHIMLNSFGERALCKLGPLDYTQAEVLNQRIEESLVFSHPGDVVEGMILATGIRPIPQVFGRGMRVPFEMTFEDEFENEIRVDAELCVERETKPKRAGVRRGTGLYGTASRGVASREALGGPQREHGFPNYLRTMKEVPQHNARRAKADAEM